jgi:hypothetical protein
MSPPPDLDSLSTAELKALVLALLARASDLERSVVTQREAERDGQRDAA